MNRIVGLETEYGCLNEAIEGPVSVITQIRNWIFRNHRYGLSDLHQRDWDEPAGNGGFLFNGGRAYLDMGHLEYCTPECLTVKDIIRYDRAGDEILTRAVREMRLSRQVGFIRNNVDHYSGATFGCHENYLVRRNAPLNERNVLSLLAFLTLRLLYCGSGRIGTIPSAKLRGDLDAPGADPHFQISQRADYITNDLFEWVQFNRAIINTRDEPLADAKRFRRLHLLHGDTNVLPASLALKVGTTALALDLLEINKLPSIALWDPVTTLHRLSHQPDGPWQAVCEDRSKVNAVSVLRLFCDAANREFKGRDEETDLLLGLWTSVLDQLESNPEKLVGIVDWITKRWLFNQFVEAEGIDWKDPWLKSQDLEFHHADPKRCLALTLAQTPEPLHPHKENIAMAMNTAPSDTRASARSQVMKYLKKENRPYFIDWEMVELEGQSPLSLSDPFEPAPLELNLWIKSYRRRQKLEQHLD